MSTLLICPSCSTHNGGEWRNPLRVAPLSLGVCPVCKTIQPITHIDYYKNIHENFEFKNRLAQPEVNQTAVLENRVAELEKNLVSLKSEIGNKTEDEAETEKPKSNKNQKNKQDML